MQKVLVLIPTYNEAPSIANLLQRLTIAIKNLSNSFEINILIIDDGSPDGTVSLAKAVNLPNLEIIERANKSGLGPSYIAGFKAGLLKDYDYFVEMDADLSHQPEESSKLLSLAAPNNFVIGTRWMAGGRVVNWPKKRQLISKLGTKYAAFALGLPFKDLTSGYRVIPRSFLQKVDLDSIETKGYGFQVEMAMNAHKLDFAIKEAPITFVERENGYSKMSLSIVWEAWFMVSLWGLRRLIFRR